MNVSKIVELIGVYDADGGLRGEAAYVIGKFVGKTHCSLCDITHSPIRRKPHWDEFVATLGIPFSLIHRNEATADVQSAIDRAGVPAVFGRTDGDTLVTILRPDELEMLGGSIPAFAQALESALSRDE